MSTRDTSKNIGHYTAMCLRVGQTWVEYDNLEKKEKSVRETFLIIPALLIYGIYSDSQN